MSVANFIPSVWSGAILKALQTKLVYANPMVINSDYEGEIANAGDTVRINMVGDVTVKNYTRNANIDAPEALTDAMLALVIDQAKYFNVAIDDIDRRQSNVDLMNEVADRIAYGLRKVFDSFVAGLYVDIASGQWDGSDSSPVTGFNASAGKAYDKLVDLGTALDETDTPEDGRWVVVPPWYHGYLEKDPRFTGYGTAENRATLENGRIGNAAGFEIFKSNQVPNVGGVKHKVIAGHRSAWSKAEQILETEGYRPELRFADALKGLHVYGAKVVRPENLAVQVASDV